MTREPFILHTALERTLNSVYALVAERHIALHTVIDLDNHEIGGDADHVEQVMWNLPTNAIKFTQESGDV